MYFTKLLLSQKRKQIVTVDGAIIKEGTKLMSDGEVPTISKRITAMTVILVDKDGDFVNGGRRDQLRNTRCC